MADGTRNTGKLASVVLSVWLTVDSAERPGLL